MKKIGDFLLSLMVFIVIVLWVYRLSLAFQALPKTESLSYIYFIVELWFFSFFLIVSGILILWLWKSEGGGRNQELAKEVRRLSLLLDRKDFQIHHPLPDEKEVRRLEVFLRPLRATTPSEWATHVIEGCFVLSGARRVSVFLKGEDGNLSLEKAMGLPEARIGQQLSSEDLAFRMFQKQKRLFVTEVETHPEIARQNRLGYVSHSFLIIPVVTYQHKELGVINLTEKENGAVFTATELDMVCNLVTIAAYRLEGILKGE